MKYIQSFDAVNEAKLSTVHRAAKKGSYPAVIVVVQDGKVIHQEPVSTPDVAPATFNVMQEKYPKALLHLEDKTGKRLFSESVSAAYNNLEKIFGTDQESMDMFQGIEDKGTVKDMIAFIDEFGNEEMLSRYGIKSTSQVKKLAEFIMGESVVNEDEDTIGGLNKMANTDLERIADYADMIKDRMSQGQTLDAWMYSKISDSVKNLNSVHDTMDGNDGVNEAKDSFYIKQLTDTFDKFKLPRKYEIMMDSLFGGGSKIAVLRKRNTYGGGAMIDTHRKDGGSNYEGFIEILSSRSGRPIPGKSKFDNIDDAMKAATKFVDGIKESVNEAKFTKRSLMKAMKKDDGMIQLSNGQEYVIYNPNNGNDDNADMWKDKVIFGLDQDGEEHEIEYSDIVRYDESRKINLKQDHLSSEEYQKAKKLKAFNKEDWEWNSKSGLYDKIGESEINERKFDNIDVKDLHFEMDPKTAEEMKIELGRRQGEINKRKQIEGGNYSLRRFRKEIKYDTTGKDLDVFRPGSYMSATSTLGDGPHKKTVKAKRWNQKMYDQWIKDVASNDGWKNAFDMAQNAKHEPGLLQWAKKMFRGEDPMQRIQWDIEAHAE